MKFFFTSVFAYALITNNCFTQTVKTVVFSKTLIGHAKPANCLAFSPNGKLLASGSDIIGLDESDSGKFEIIIWDITDSKISGRLLGHKDAIQSIAFSKNGTKLVSSDSKGIIKVWDIANFKEINTIIGDNWVSTVCLTPDDRYVIGEYSFEKKVDLWDFETGELIFTLPVNLQIGSMDISPDGAKIALSCYHKIQIWSLISKKQLHTIDDNSVNGFAIKYSSDNKFLAVGSGGGEIKLLDPENLKLKYTLSGHFKPVLSVSFSKDGKYLISGSSDQMAKVWSLQTRKQIKSLVNVHNGMINAVSFNPLSNLFATSGSDRTIKLWKIQ